MTKEETSDRMVLKKDCSKGGFIMSNGIRCPRCFAPKDHEEDKCDFCGYQPSKETQKGKYVEEIAMEHMDLIYNNEPLPEGISLDERLEIITRRCR